MSEPSDPDARSRAVLRALARLRSEIAREDPASRRPARRIALALVEHALTGRIRPAPGEQDPPASEEASS